MTAQSDRLALSITRGPRQLLITLRQFYLCIVETLFSTVWVRVYRFTTRNRQNDTIFPRDLPVPEDDGACAHLSNFRIPSLQISTTSGNHIDLSSLPGLTILFYYPRTGAPGEDIPDSWNATPGVRGYTPQACGFRDTTEKLYKPGVNSLFGISTQNTEYQKEAKERLHPPYGLLSDERLKFVEALNLPTFEQNNCQLVKRLALAIEDVHIIKFWYPVFPLDKNVEDVVQWLENERLRRQ